MKYLLLLTLTSCGGAYHHIGDRQITFEPTTHTDDKREGGILGTCFYFINEIEKNFIIMDKDKIEANNISYRMVLLHELGHCMFGLDHTEPKFFDDGCTSTLMATFLPPSANSNQCYNEHKEFYEAQYLEWHTCHTRDNCKDLMW
jgi:hypothetical protein